MVEAFLFDLDGTLVDSADQIAFCVNDSRIDLGYPPADLRTIRSKIGLPAEELFQDLELNSEEVNNLIGKFRSKLSEQIQINNDLFPGVFDLLTHLGFMNLKIGVATSKPQSIALEVVAASDLKNLVHHVQGLENFPAKPDPRVIRECMYHLNVSTAIMVGDRIEDIMASNRAGCISIGVAQGSHSIDQLNQAGAHFTYESILQLSLNLDEILCMAP